MAERMVGKQAPRFEMEAVLASKEFGKVSLEENMKKINGQCCSSINGFHFCLPDRNYSNV